MDIHDRVKAAVRPERVVEIARALCSVPSPLGGEGAVGAMVAELLDRPGIEVHHEEVVAGRPNVIATVRGNGARPPLVLNGHLDATVHLDDWSHDPFDPWLADDRLYGGGITDMKGAVAAMIAATEAAARIGDLPGDLILQAVMHHDGTGLGTKYALASEGPTNGFAICGEPSALAIHTGNGGAVKFEIELTGRAAHICRADEGIDSLAPALAVYAALSKHTFTHDPHPRLPDLPRMLIGQLTAGSSPAHVPGRTVLRGDVRTVPGLDRTAVQRELAAVVARECPPDVVATVRVISTHQPFLGATSGALVDAVSAGHAAVRGAPPAITSELPGQAFVTDAADLVAAGLETVVYGPGVWRFAPDESVAVGELVDAARVYLGVTLSLGTSSDAGIGAVAVGA
jgi:acetylornithine deacetylase/succinyl-diaminopimelate desuccinylase-like protein